MTITTTTHLNFRRQARAALQFYQSVFGGQIMLMTHAQIYPSYGDDEADLIAYGQVQSPAGFSIMAFDVPDSRPYDPGHSALFVSINGTDADELTGYWTGLSHGATIIQPLGPAGFSPLYGMLTDKLGITWVLALTAAS